MQYETYSGKDQLSGAKTADHADALGQRLSEIDMEIERLSKNSQRYFGSSMGEAKAPS